MAVLSELFNPYFFMFLGILILIALLVIYYESKIREQNHKISSMLSLVSSLAEEFNGIQIGLKQLHMKGGFNLPNFPINVSKNPLAENTYNYHNEDLIEVSDDDTSSDDTSDAESVDTESVDAESLDAESVEDESVEDESVDDIDIDIACVENDLLLENDVKILKLNIDNNASDKKEILTNEVNLINDEILTNDEILINNEILSNDQINEVTETLYNENNENNETNENNENNETNGENAAAFLELKTININLEENANENLDYKKYSLNKLRTVVVEKGLIADSSKLKKPELLKLLGVE